MNGIDFFEGLALDWNYLSSWLQGFLDYFAPFLAIIIGLSIGYIAFLALQRAIFSSQHASMYFGDPEYRNAFLAWSTRTRRQAWERQWAEMGATIPGDADESDFADDRERPVAFV